MQYFYDKQIRKYIQQFIRLFSGFSVEMGTNSDGTKIYQTVPVRYGDVSRMAAHIVKDNSENVVNATPFVSCYVSDMSIAPERRTHAQYNDKVQVYEKKFDLSTNEYKNEVGDTYQITRYQPVPYNLTMQVDIWTSNTEQKLQLLEQMLVLFNPSLNIHTNTNPFDWTSLSYVELTNMTWSVRSVPSGVDEIIDVSTLQFELPIFISPPVKVQKQTLIHTILNKINQVDNDNLQSFKLNESFTSQFNSFKIVTLENFKLRYEDGYATILNKAGGNTDDDGLPLDWSKILPAYGEMRDGISQIRLRQSTDPTDSSQDIIGTLSYDSVNAQRLLVTLDAGTQPSNTQGTVDAIIDPANVTPGNGIPPASSGQRYLILSGTNNSGLWGVDADKNDIIAYNGTNWIVAFDASANPGTEFVTNTTTGDQFEWTGSQWQNSFEGIYKEGFWRIYL
tara:strand:+ start:3224 stop:4570 length:1347 start_codon:yes stop_codon:yes gene_type:complete